jgi:hypothetical protein
VELGKWLANGNWSFLSMPSSKRVEVFLGGSAKEPYSSQEGLEEVLGLGVKVVSISGAKGKRLLEAQQWKSRPYRQAGPSAARSSHWSSL